MSAPTTSAPPASPSARSRRRWLRRPRLVWSVTGLGVAGVIAAAAAQIPHVGGAIAWLLAISFVTFCLYAGDKFAARTRRSRIPELSLHVLALAGGTPGAWMGMTLLRHKTLKAGFRALFFVILALQLVLIGYLIAR